VQTRIKTAVAQSKTSLVELFGVRPVLAAKFLGEVGDVHRFPTKHHFATHTGTAPLEASSGQVVRQRLSRAGGRKLNHALYMMAIVQIRHPTAGQTYYRLPAQTGRRQVGQGSVEFSFVYLVYNAISCLLTQDQQVECFRNAARHVEPGGRFVIEVFVPDLQRLPPGETARPFHVGKRHLGFDTFDLVNQRLVSHHYWIEDGAARTFRSPHRFVWPSELDPMAKLAGLELRERWADWNETPFTAASTSHVSVWEKPHGEG
jgi:hypothetical protein